MAGNDGVDRLPPFVARHVDVGVAHSAKENLELHVARPELATLDLEWSESRVGRLRRISSRD
jgi:hypothetical protein